MTSPASQAWIEAAWPAPPGIRALTTTRHGMGASLPPFDAFNLGARCGDDPAAVAENRRQLALALGLPSPPRWLKQVHGVDVVRFAPSLSLHATDADEPEADAALTTTPGTVLAILTADCLPVVLAARDGREIAAAHAGWRGLAAGMLEAIVSSMATAPGELVAWLGPAAGPRAYEIGEEVFDAFVGRDARAAVAFVATRPGHWRIDLHALARMRLAEAGLASGDVHGGGLCTISDPARFFSHRRDGRSGRIATLAWIAP